MSIVEQKESKKLAEHFFRHEYAKMVSVITRYFGLKQVNMAEDIVQDTLLEAINTWDYRGIPENPKAWLYTVAKNKALNTLRRDKYKSLYEQETKAIDQAEVETLFSEEQIADDQLRMMFACCHPSISEEAQVSLILKTLCGLSIGEIARAFLTSNETINKRLVRARKALRASEVAFEIPDPKLLEDRLETVLKTIYLLFNEGYSASHGDKLIRFEFCLEAIRLTELITSHPSLAQYSSPHALQALMLLNASRFNARVDHNQHFVRMVHQDRSLWDQRLINQGLLHLDRIKGASQIGIYHILATISAYHCTAPDYASTNWKAILDLYDNLISFDTSPLVRLNRAIVVARVHGVETGIQELLAIQDSIPDSYHLFYSTLAELYMENKEYNKAIAELEKALEHASLPSEVGILNQRIEACRKQLP